jgi:hypothetical protein
VGQDHGYGRRFQYESSILFISFFDKKYFAKPGGQVHLWDPPEYEIKKDISWGPSTTGFATFWAQISLVWDNFKQAKRDQINDKDWEMTPLDKFTHHS